MDIRSRSVVFVVDDDDAVCRALAFALDLEGFGVETFPSGEALLKHDLPEANACVVIDERLPGVSGLETLRRLRGRQIRLPVILMTSHPKTAFRAAAEEAGAPLLEKPLLSDTLVATIHEVLDRRSRERTSEV